MSTQPLAGIRIIEHGQLLAVPAAARMLADLGAEVIKVEPAFRLDTHRQTTYPDNDPGERFWDRGGTFHSENRGKLGLTLNLRHDAAVEVFKDLVRVSDVVMENFTPRVMPAFGLDYESLCEVRPELIMLSSTGYGQNGPWSSFKAVGPTTESASGLAAVTGYEGGVPLLPDIPYTDYVAADQAVLAILLALFRRKRAGRGSYIDISQVEAQASLAGELFLDAAINGTVHQPRGNRHPAMAPHDFFPCTGEDRWIAIAVSSDREWLDLVAAMGNPSWASDQRFATLEGRLETLSVLNQRIAEWTRGWDAMELMELLQARGVPAGAVFDARDLVLNEHLHARGFFEWDTQAAETGIPEQPKPYPGAPWRFSRSTHGISRRAPMLGEHNATVLTELLGYSSEKISELQASGAFGGPPTEFPRPNPVGLPTLKANHRVNDIDSEYEARIAAIRAKYSGTSN